MVEGLVGVGIVILVVCLIVACICYFLKCVIWVVKSLCGILPGHFTTFDYWLWLGILLLYVWFLVYLACDCQYESEEE
jgi:hypothetical protein